MKVRIIAGALAALFICAGGAIAADVNDKPFEEAWWPSKWAQMTARGVPITRRIRRTSSVR